MGIIIEGVKIYTKNEVAELLKVNPTTIDRMLKDGRLTGRKLGGKWHISAKELERYLAPEHGQGDTAGYQGKRKRR